MLLRDPPLAHGRLRCAKLLYEDLRAVSVAEGWFSLFAARAALAIEGSRALVRIAITTEMQVEAQPTSASFAGIELLPFEAREKGPYHGQLHYAKYAVRVSVLTVQAFSPLL